MLKKYFSISLLLVSSVHSSHFSNFFKGFEDSFKNMREQFEKIEENDILKIKDEGDAIEAFIKLPHNFPAEKMKLNVSQNKNFKIEIGEGEQYLIISGGQRGMLLGLSATLKDEKKKNKKEDSSHLNTQSSSRQWNVSTQLDFKEIKIEHEEKTNQLIISIPKIPDPNNRSVTLEIPKRKK